MFYICSSDHKMPIIIIKKKQETQNTTREITPREKAVTDWNVKQKEKLRFENREPDYHELQELLFKANEKIKKWKNRFYVAKNDYGRNCDFTEEVHIFGLGCKVCGGWFYDEIDYVDEFRVTGERWAGNDRIPVCDECAEKCKARDEDYEDSDDETDSD